MSLKSVYSVGHSLELKTSRCLLNPKSSCLAVKANVSTMLSLISGDHLCEVSAAVYGSRPAVSGAELPSHCNTQSNDPGRKVSTMEMYY